MGTVKQANADSSAQRDENLRLVARVRKLFNLDAAAPVRGDVPVGGRFQGDPPGRGNIPGRAVETPAARDRVPTDAGAGGLPPQEPLNRDQMMILVKSAASVYGPALGRDPGDVEAMLWEEAGRALDAGIRPFVAALEVAKRQVISDVRAKVR